MTPTETLRAMLDERDVEWTSERVSNGVLFTFAKDGRTYSVFVRDRAGLEIWSQYLTPEQAIAATLGLGTCHAIDTGYATAFCSVCGAEFMGSIMTNEPPDYVKPPTRCPECGRKIVEVDE